MEKRILTIALVFTIVVIGAFAPMTHQFGTPEVGAIGGERYEAQLGTPQHPPTDFRVGSLGSPGSGPQYDEQLGMTFTQGFSSLAYNVTAVEQDDGSGYGPAYLINGLTGAGYWFQVGLSWNWCGPVSGACQGYVAGFGMTYEVFDPSGESVFPTNGGGGLVSLSGTVDEGDTVGLKLGFSGGEVVMSAYDYATGASASEEYSSFGSSEFIGNPESTSNNNGYFTGLMTEEYFFLPNFANEEQVTYKGSNSTLTSAWLWADEFNANDSQSIFSANTKVPVTLSDQLVEFSSNNATLYGFSHGMITGQIALLLDLSATPILVDLGESAQSTVTMTAIGGVGPYSFSVYLDGEMIGTFSSNTSTVLEQLNLGLLQLGNHSLFASSTDSRSDFASSESVNFTVNPDPIVILNLPQETYDVGQSLMASAHVSGGTGPFQVLFFLDGQMIPSSGQYNLTEVGTELVQATVSDATGFSVNSSEVRFQVNTDPTGSVQVAETATDVNLPIQLTAESQGGSPPYTYSWEVNGTAVASTGGTMTYEAPTPGEYTFAVQISDSAGFVLVSPDVRITVNPLPQLVNYTLRTSSDNPFLLRDKATLSANVTGGTPPLQFMWFLNGLNVENTTSASFTFSLGKLGSNTVEVRVVDDVGYMLGSQPLVVHYEVNYVSVLLVLAAAGIVAVSITALTLRSRARSREKGNEGPT